MMTDDVIWVVTQEPAKPEPGEGSRSGGTTRDLFREPGFAGGSQVRTSRVETNVLEQNMTNFLQRMGRVLTRAKQSAGELAGMELDEIELSVEINSEGKVSLWGTGATVGGKGAMMLKFKAVKPPAVKPEA